MPPMCAQPANTASNCRHGVLIMRWTGRGIGLAISIFMLLMTIGAGINEALVVGEWVGSVEGIFILLLLLMGLVATILSWRRLPLAGGLLVMIAIAFAIIIGVTAGRNHFLAWLMVGFPYLVAGGLFLSSWRLSRTSA